MASVDEREEAARQVVCEGLREARAISHPLMRARHLASWAARASRVAPEAAADLAEHIAGEDPATATQLFLTLTGDRLQQGADELERYFRRTLELARETAPEQRLHTLNELSELAMELSEQSPERTSALLRQLVPEARDLTAPELEIQQPRVLACALIGEALLGAGDEAAGLELLAEAERESAGLPARDPILTFLAEALAERQPERALELAEAVEDPVARLQARLQLLGKIAPEHRERLLAGAEADTEAVDEARRPEVLVRMGQAAGARDPERARRYFRQALELVEHGEPQVRSLHTTGVAAAVASVDREWAGELFRSALEAAGQEEERVRRVATLCVIANEMAESHPREAEAVFRQAMEEGQQL
ncbi:MAG TPA: hypothetical protein VFU47_09460, partial [Armatimonadota bacterium]|nr:hypothetical protein [Armatimonadota bacterium]